MRCGTAEFEHPLPLTWYVRLVGIHGTGEHHLARALTQEDRHAGWHEMEQTGVIGVGVGDEHGSHFRRTSEHLGDHLVGPLLQRDHGGRGEVVQRQTYVEDEPGGGGRYLQATAPDLMGATMDDDFHTVGIRKRPSRPWLRRLRPVPASAAVA